MTGAGGKIPPNVLEEQEVEGSISLTQTRENRSSIDMVSLRAESLKWRIEHKPYGTLVTCRLFDRKRSLRFKKPVTSRLPV